MKKKTILILIYFVISATLFAQKTVSNYITSGNENYSIINISRSYTYQEWYFCGKLLQQVFINDQPVCEIPCQSRVSIKVFSEGKVSISVKFLPNKKVKQKNIDKQFLSGKPLEIDIVHGKTYFANVDIKQVDKGLLAYFTTQIVSIPESESMYKDEPRFIKFPEIKEFIEDVNSPFIKK
jgi:hypothetical protein